MTEARYVVIWEFQVKQGATSAFEKIYGPDGGWAQLFRRSPDYFGTKLIRDRARPTRYLTLDHWTSGKALHSFKHEHNSEYAALDKQCETLTEHESLLGEFESLSGG